MRKIKNIAIRTMQMGFIEESEGILRSLMVAQIEQMGALHEDSLDTIVLLSHNLAHLNRWDDVQDLLSFLEETEKEINRLYTPLRQAITEIESILAQQVKIVG